MEKRRQSVNAAACAIASDASLRRVQRSDRMNLQPKACRYCESYISLGFTWSGNPEYPSPLCIVFGVKKVMSTLMSVASKSTRARIMSL